MQEEKYFKCDSCSTTKHPTSSFSYNRFRPKEGVFESKLEDRYCNTCNDLTLCFLSEAETNELNDLGDEMYYKNRIQDIERKKKSFLFFIKDVFKKENKELLELKKTLVTLYTNRVKHEEYISKSKDFYSKLPELVKCLTCSNTDILPHLTCNCGGEFSVFTRKKKRIILINPGTNYNAYDKFGNVENINVKYDKVEDLPYSAYGRGLPPLKKNINKISITLFLFFFANNLQAQDTICTMFSENNIYEFNFHTSEIISSDSLDYKYKTIEVGYREVLCLDFYDRLASEEETLTKIKRRRRKVITFYPDGSKTTERLESNQNVYYTPIGPLKVRVYFYKFPIFKL